MSGPRLRFCKESNDLLYPREDKDRKRLVYYCKNCSYTEDADEVDWCVYRNAVKEVKDKTVITQDVRFNPTLPRTKDVQCPACNHNESVYYTSATSTGMTLHFQCTDCGNKWQDSV
mmetsp:Transcript_14974/g.42044  ORF Transcript_14974/g.42044 Transcript_14974/m.42044 type:complete len:116 (-) Transcript_14974:624-971(-)|eukprot:CAMPEP_0117674328 /NCGR_PEP_ID=MMETSP0804-20121206/14976_1 /TAXON_ID=1074897 /ORGANISM="Tetraselmis astigmatica, Strain CCMP880" /LENGTH=115 /DNA_ID=CAMNT_0005483183 /DNA_START=220 /DNA_END=567 /DNA_ORIENTATION=+